MKITRSGLAAASVFMLLLLLTHAAGFGFWGSAAMLLTAGVPMLAIRLTLRGERRRNHHIARAFAAAISEGS